MWPRWLAEPRSDVSSEFVAIRSIASKRGIGSPKTLHKRVCRAEIDDGVKPGESREDVAKIEELKTEVAELCWGM